MIRNAIAGIFSFTLLYLSSFLGTIFVHGLALPLLLIRPSWFSRFSDSAIGMWLILPTALLELVYGVKVVLTGDLPLKDDSALIIMNHRCRLDWMFYWTVIIRHGRLGNEKIILKNELKHIPGIGWAMQNALYIFLKRRWEQDQEYFNDVLDHFAKSMYPFQLLIFPEGTNLDNQSRPKSRAFAEKYNLPNYEHVLHPRVRGFTFCVKKLREGSFDAIHNVTVGYSSDRCYRELDYVLGTLPEEVHFHVQRHPSKSLPTDDKELEEWCKTQWEEKEERLTEFYNGKYRMTDVKENINLRDSNEASLLKSMKFAIVFWSAFVVFTLGLLYYSRLARWYFFVQVILFFVQSTFNGGLDRMQLSAHKRFGYKQD